MKRLTVLLTLLLAAPAQASTITGSWDPKFGESYAFQAAPGETNQVTIEPAGEDLRITDTAGAPTGVCVAESPTTVRCPGAPALYVFLGDGDDTLLNRSTALDGASGEAGNDRLETTTATWLHGDDGDDTLVGGAGNDRVEGGPGRDRLIGAGGADRFLLGADGPQPAPDVVSGGSGTDVVDYSGRSTDLRIDLARDRGPDGDVFAGIERAIGGYGDDVLIGDAGPNRLEGDLGTDRIDGGAGDDMLIGAGKDTLIGRGGDDYLDSGDGSDVRCGAGHDRVWAGGEKVPRVHTGCEVVRGPGPVLRLRSGRLRASWDGDASYGRPCRLRVTVGGHRVAAGRWVPVRRPATVRITPVGACDPDYDQVLPPAVFRLV